MWDVGSIYKQPPFLLEGGFLKFLYAYPHYVTNPKARAPADSRPVIKASSNIDINYPDLDNGFLVTPSPSPKHIAAVNSGALKISKAVMTEFVGFFKNLFLCGRVLLYIQCYIVHIIGWVL